MMSNAILESLKAKALKSMAAYPQYDKAYFDKFSLGMAKVDITGKYKDDVRVKKGEFLLVDPNSLHKGGGRRSNTDFLDIWDPTNQCGLSTFAREIQLLGGHNG
jgi:hypothetical protein